jgi:hypothetical protein
MKGTNISSKISLAPIADLASSSIFSKQARKDLKRCPSL